MSTVALNNLWTYIESMGLSARNRKWLADRLIEPSKADITKKETTMVVDSFRRSMQEVKEAERNGKELQSLDSLLEELEIA